MELNENSKILALNKIDSALSALEISSAYYNDKESFKKFTDAYYHLTENIIQFIKDDNQKHSLDSITKQLEENVDYLKKKKTVIHEF